MEIILLSGGSGKRLWPLSNDARAKQFLRVLEDENGARISMLERVWNQLREVNLDDSAIVATSSMQAEVLESQIGREVPLIVEPEKRDTFPAIALAATYLYSEKHISEDEIVAILPVDPYVDTAFFEKIKEMETVIEQTGAELALIGVTPTFPSSKYGYIVPEDNQTDSHIEVARFQEKPEEKQAESLIEQGALWNTGVFAFKLKTVLDILRNKNFPIKYHQLLHHYEDLPKISFDYEVVERLQRIVALSYDGYWKDLGTWNTLTEEMNHTQIGVGNISEDSTNTHLINELDIPVNILGISNAVVAVSPDGILISDKQASPRIKELLDKEEQRPMYEETKWGWYKIFDYTFDKDDIESLTRRIHINKGENLPFEYHRHRKETWIVVKGSGHLIKGSDIFEVDSGQVIDIPANTAHSIKAVTELEIVEIQYGSHLVESETEVISKNWVEIIKKCTNNEQNPAL
ncbi:mannose-1-phosphate guanylyltransferase [Sinobaca qinghaiensis]|uniref:Mannose-1-phosphate guanylyltransferase n=1 Tax=Sinobaca qinghaiensis TaxID=342944 RepID=A0A419V8B5_9BACL|nr:sugar phosphate nucleotidyltransferase [Sinobaca qinghaiensis]RKD76315.1 mannose-1-phosphate guanylyltransferase [Sinobaca qinghaiensis]